MMPLKATFTKQVGFYQADGIQRPINVDWKEAFYGLSL